MSSVQSYFQRFGFCPQQLSAPPPTDLRLVVVIPCHNEPDLGGALQSLWQCERLQESVEVIAVINGSSDADEKIRAQNQRSLEEAREWVRDHHDQRLSFHLIHRPDLPPKRAGVGLARKIGMDEALWRFDATGRLEEGIIVGYDADCRCAANYLTAIDRHFHQTTPACSIHFEHPLEGPLDPGVYDAVATYELHLRYYVEALRHAKFPFAYHTVGSSMAVRAGVYMAQGGMNKRQAGEDFYFLHKVIPLGSYSELLDTVVWPSPRASDRVPFGTGKAVGAALAGESLLTYPLEAFLDLQELFRAVTKLYRADPAEITGLMSGWPETVRTFLFTQSFVEAIAEMNEHTATVGTFQQRFFRWFDGFRAMKFVHHARDRFYGPRPVAPEAARLLPYLKHEEPAEKPEVIFARALNSAETRQLLAKYRQIALSRGIRLPRSTNA